MQKLRHRNKRLLPRLGAVSNTEPRPNVALEATCGYPGANRCDIHHIVFPVYSCIFFNGLRLCHEAAAAAGEMGDLGGTRNRGAGKEIP